MTFRDRRRVEWGDCDEAGVVFYPNYFRWMDGVFHAMCEAAGHDQRSLRSTFGVFGTPLIDAKAAFRVPATFGQRLDVTVTIERWSTSSMTLAYHFARDGTVILDGEEARVFVRRDQDGRMVKTPVPEAFKDAVSNL